MWQSLNECLCSMRLGLTINSGPVLLGRPKWTRVFLHAEIDVRASSVLEFICHWAENGRLYLRKLTTLLEAKSLPCRLEEGLQVEATSTYSAPGPTQSLRTADNKTCDALERIRLLSKWDASHI